VEWAAIFCDSIVRSMALTLSRKAAARSYSVASEAACICFDSSRATTSWRPSRNSSICAIWAR